MSSTPSSSTFFFKRVGRVAQQQLNGVAISHDRIDCKAFLDWQVVAKETFDEVGKRWVSWGSSLGFNLMQVVVMKAPIDLFDQLRGCLQVDLSGMDIHMAHIGGQPWKPGVDILSVPIPGQQPVNRKGVSQVVDAGAGELAVTDSALPQQVLEGLIDGAGVQAAGSLVEEERGVGRAWRHLQPFAQVLLQGLGRWKCSGAPNEPFGTCLRRCRGVARRCGSPPGSRPRPPRSGSPCCREAPEESGRCEAEGSSAAAVWRRPPGAPGSQSGCRYRVGEPRARG